MPECGSEKRGDPRTGVGDTAGSGGWGAHRGGSEGQSRETQGGGVPGAKRRESGGEVVGMSEAAPRRELHEEVTCDLGGVMEREARSGPNSQRTRMRTDVKSSDRETVL